MNLAPFADSKTLFGTVRPATAAELAAVYAAVAGSGTATDTVAPTVVLAFPDHRRRDDVAAAATRLLAFGVRVVAVAAGGAAGHDGCDCPPALAVAVGAEHAVALPHRSVDGGVRLERATFLLGGPLHGWSVVDVTDEDLHLEAVVALVESQRLRVWADLLEPSPDPVFTTTHRPGSDSTGVVQFRAGRDGREVVAKIGPRGVIETEAEFLAGGNSWLRSVDQPPLFPDLYAVHVEGDQAVSLMEAAEPAHLADRLFADARKTDVRADAVEALEPYLDRLSTWYRLTVEDREPTVGDYLYRERFHLLPEYPAFRSTFASLVPGADLDDLLARDVVLPGGLRLPGYAAAVGWLDRASPEFVPRSGTAVHGDFYVTNLLRRADGSPVLIDPRTVWEGRDRPDVGYGDPVFDLATVLHALLPMVAILDAVAKGASDRLFAGPIDPGGDPLDLSGLTLPVRFTGPLREVERRLVAVPPTGEPERVVRTRLSIGAANSLAGWLKYERSLKTQEAWMATYAYVVWYLWRAQAVWEDRADLEADR
jgi:Phosphotransferase enzyme family